MKIDGPGQYVAPFTLKLPSHCPPSFRYSFVDSLGCLVQSAVVYKVTARLECSKTNITHFKYFTVNTLQKFQKVDIWNNDLVVDGCCMTNGVTHVQSSFVSHLPFELGNELNVTLRIDNQNSSEIIAIRVDVVLNCEVVGNKQIFRNSRILASRNRQVSIRQKDIQSFGIYLDLEGDLNPSTITTSLQTCNFSLFFTFSYNFFCCSKTSSFEIPLLLSPQAEILKTPPSLPDDWSPCENPITSLLW
jgi:hypothetical protein